MNLTRAQALELAAQLADSTGNIVVCPSFPWLANVAGVLAGSGISLGAQDVHWADHGSFTGDVSAPMLRELGVSHVIIGHSDRRHHHRESDTRVKAKAEAALRHGLVPIICVGETDIQRQEGQHEQAVRYQLEHSLPESTGYVIAYEPVWAIGTGKTATLDDIKTMHGFIRNWLAKRVDPAGQVAILYGGSVKAVNAAEILAVPNVDGVLVGGASLQAGEFKAIVQAC